MEKVIGPSLSNIILSVTFFRYLQASKVLALFSRGSSSYLDDKYKNILLLLMNTFDLQLLTRLRLVPA